METLTIAVPRSIGGESIVHLTAERPCADATRVPALDWDARLVSATRMGNAAALEAIFRMYAADLCAFVARNVRSREVAEELVQELFLKIWRQRELWEVKGSLRTYLYAAARHAALNHLRHERIAQRWTERISYVLSAEQVGRRVGDATSLLEARELAEAVSRVVAELPDRCRMAFELSRHHHMNYAEIAAVLGVKVKTVENQIGIALKTIRRRVGPLLA